MSGVPLLSKSQAQVDIISGSATVVPFVNVVVAPKQTVFVLKDTRGLGLIVTELMAVFVQPEELVIVNVVVFIPGVRKV